MTFFRDMLDDLRSKPLYLVIALVLLLALVYLALFFTKPVKPPNTSSIVPPPTNTPPQGNLVNISAVPKQVKDGTSFPGQTTKSVRAFPRGNPFHSRTAELALATQGAGVAGTPGGATGASGAVPSDGGSTGFPTTGGGGGGGGGGGTSYYQFVAKVRFGEEGKKSKTTTLDGLEALPSTNNPILVFLGITAGGNTAVFLLSSSATTTGDGKCQPSDDECSFLYMKKGDIQTIEAVSADGNVTTYEMKLSDIDVQRTTSPRASSSKNARKAALRSKAENRQLKRRAAIDRRKERRQERRRMNRVVGVFGALGSF